MDMRRGALARGVKLLFERRNLCPEINKLNLQPLTLDREPVDKVTFLAQLHKLACDFVFKLFDDYFEASRRHRKFCAQQIFIGLYLFK